MNLFNNWPCCSNEDYKTTWSCPVVYSNTYHVSELNIVFAIVWRRFRFDNQVTIKTIRDIQRLSSPKWGVDFQWSSFSAKWVLTKRMSSLLFWAPRNSKSNVSICSVNLLNPVEGPGSRLGSGDGEPPSTWYGNVLKKSQMKNKSFLQTRCNFEFLY